MTVRWVSLANSRHPWVIALLLGCILAGARGVLLPPDPLAPIDLFMPQPYRAIYHLILLLAGLLTLVGIWLPRPRDQLMVELTGMWFLSAPLLIYPFAVFLVFGGPIGVGGSVSVMLGAGGAARIVAILLELRALRADVEPAP